MYVEPITFKLFADSADLPSYHPLQHLITVSYLISSKWQLFKNMAHDGSQIPKAATRLRSHWKFLNSALYVLIELHLCSEAILG